MAGDPPVPPQTVVVPPVAPVVVSPAITDQFAALLREALASSPGGLKPLLEKLAILILGAAITAASSALANYQRKAPQINVETSPAQVKVEPAPVKVIGPPSGPVPAESRPSSPEADAWLRDVADALRGLKDDDVSGGLVGDAVGRRTAASWKALEASIKTGKDARRAADAISRP